MPRLTVGLLAALLAAPTLLTAQPVPAGPEFLVNTFTTGRQSLSTVGADGAGRFVVLWTSEFEDGSATGVFGQRYDAGGAALGTEFQVNTYTFSGQSVPSVAVDGAGDFVVTWESYFQDGSQYGVFGRRYDAGGAPLAGEFQANTYTTGWQNNSSVAMDSAGDFVVVWSGGVGQDGSSYGIFAQRYDAAGARASSEFQVNTYTTGEQTLPVVAMDGAGDFAVVWQSLGQDGNDNGVFGRRFDSTGAPLGGEFQVNTYTWNDQGY